MKSKSGKQVENVENFSPEPVGWRFCGIKSRETEGEKCGKLGGKCGKLRPSGPMRGKFSMKIRVGATNFHAKTGEQTEKTGIREVRPERNEPGRTISACGKIS